MREKNLYTSLISIVLFCVICLIAYSLIGASDKDNNIDGSSVSIQDQDNEINVPSLNSMVENKDNLISLVGLAPSDLYKEWGSPTGTLSGLFGEVWSINDEYDLIVYYDFETQKVSNAAISEHYKDDAESNLDVVSEISNITETGCVLSLLSEDEFLSYETGSAFWLECKTDLGWENVKTIIPKDEIAWTQELYMINSDSPTVFNIVWSTFYGELSSGTYRIGKTVSYISENNEYLSEILYINFEIE